jgi:cyclase
VIAHASTAYMMRNFIAKSIERYPKTTETMQAQLASGKDDSGKPLTDKDRAELQQEIAGRELVAVEIKGLVPHMPDITFDDELDLDLGNRPIQIKYLGRGNTAGDAIVFLPNEKILIAGDTVVHPVPFLGSGYPSEWADTIQRMIDLQPQIVVPGHGEVLHGTAYLMQVQALLRTVIAHVREIFFDKGNGRPFEDVKKDVLASMDFEALRRQFDRGDPDNFDQSSAIPDSLVKNAFDEIRVR